MAAARASHRSSATLPTETAALSTGRPTVRVPVLSITRVSAFSRRCSDLASRISTPSRAPRPTPVITDTGVASPSAHGHAMMSTDTAATRALASEGAGTERAPGGKCDGRRHHYGGDEPGRNDVRSRLDRCPRPAGGRHHRGDLRDQGLGADSIRTHREPAGPVHGAAGDRVAGAALDRDRLAGDHRLVDARGAVEHGAVGRHPLAGSDPQPVARHDRVDGDVALRSVGVEPSRDGGGGGEGEQAANRVAGPGAGAKLQHLPEE